MAEARAFQSVPKIQFSMSDKGLVLKADEGAIPFLANSWKRSLIRRYYNYRNSFRNGTWPAHPYLWVLSVAILSSAMLSPSTPAEVDGWSLSSSFKGFSKVLWELEPYIVVSSSSFPVELRALIVSTCIGVIIFSFVGYGQRYILRMALTYKGWLYQEPRKTNLGVMIWGFVVRFFQAAAASPTLYSFQKSLPNLPVPPLKQTCNRYLESMEEILDKAEHAKMVKLAAEFEKGVGPKLQRYLVLKSWVTSNYVTDWWEKYVYLRGRSSIMINSNYYGMGSHGWVPTKSQTARGAQLLFRMSQFQRMISQQKLAPLRIRGTVPLCMNQYERMFSTVRVPGVECDTLEHYGRTHHVAVLCNGCYYTFSTQSLDGSPLPPHVLENQLDWIVEDSKLKSPTDAERNIGALTAGERSFWAKTRKEILSQDGNRRSLRKIETASFLLCLDDTAPDLENLSETARPLMHGNGGDRWFDKSVQLIIYRNGAAGLNAEHSWADAPVIAHMWEWICASEMRTHSYDEAGRNLSPKTSSQKIPTYNVPQLLTWALDTETAKLIEKQLKENHGMIADLDLRVVSHDSFGKGYIKKCKVSPDAFIQMALQLAYYRDASKLCLTYEASMTRLFREGRTETVRPVTRASAKFVKAMCDAKKNANERLQLLQEAAVAHQSKFRDAMAGRGVDRHLFALYVVSKGRDESSPFLDAIINQNWTLSTSQQPQQQTDLWDATKDGHMNSPGGGFGPVADNGYGVSYMIAGENKIYFHVSSKKSSKVSNTDRFVGHLQQALADMRALLP